MSFSEVVAGYQALVGDVHVIEDFDEMTEELTLDLKGETGELPEEDELSEEEELSEDDEDITEDLSTDVLSLMNEKSRKKMVKIRRKYEVKVLLR